MRLDKRTCYALRQSLLKYKKALRSLTIQYPAQSGIRRGKNPCAPYDDSGIKKRTSESVFGGVAETEWSQFVRRAAALLFFRLFLLRRLHLFAFLFQNTADGDAYDGQQQYRRKKDRTCQQPYV